MSQAAAYNRRQEPVASSANLADGFMSMLSRIGGTAQTVTETVRQTITVGGDGGAGALTNATGAVTVTITAPASTVSLCPGQAQGAADGVQDGGDGAGSGGAPAVVVATGGVGVTVVSVPEEARKTSIVGNPPAVTQPAATQPAASGSQPADAASQSTDLSSQQTDAGAQPTDAGSSLAPLPSQGEANQPSLVTPPGLSGAPSVTSLAPLPSASSADPSADPSAVPIVGAPVSDGSAAASSSTLAQLPGLASSLSNTLVLPGTTTAPAATPVADPGGAFGGSVGFIPMESAEVVPANPTTPAIANGAGAGPSIDVSGLKLSSQLNLGNLVQQTASASP